MLRSKIRKTVFVQIFIDLIVAKDMSPMEFFASDFEVTQCLSVPVSQESLTVIAPKYIFLCVSRWLRVCWLQLIETYLPQILLELHRKNCDCPPDQN